MNKHQRIAVVTGGSSGIGAATCARLAEDGCTVVIFDLNEAASGKVIEDISAKGGVGRFVKVDVTDEVGLRDAFMAIRDEFGHPADILVNSAGIVVPSTASRAVDPEFHRKVWEVNYFGTFNASRIFADIAIKAKQRACIVNLASTSSLRPVPAAHYTPGKYAVKGLTELQAAEFGAKGIRVNAVAPTFTMTPPMLARIEAGFRTRESIMSQSALKMLVTPQHIADGICFLASDRAAAITGITMPIDAGWLVSVPYESMDAPIVDVDDGPDTNPSIHL